MELADSFETKYIKYFLLFLGGSSILMLTVAILLNDSDSYTLIVRDTEVSGWVSKIDRQRGMIFFNIEDSSKYKVGGLARNYQYPQNDLFFFLSDGDWLEKKRGSDTLLIERHSTVRKSNYYIFVLGMELNKELKKGN